MLNSVKFVQNQSNKLSSNQSNAEWWLCRKNPFYFIFNYVYLPEIGGVLKYEESQMNSKIKQTVRAIARYHKCILMASRQLGKALHINTDIPLYNGNYKKMESIQIGDILYDAFNNPTTVIKITDIMHNRPCYSILFSNGEQVICDQEHEWTFFNETIPTYRIYSDLKKYTRIPLYNSPVYIDDMKPIISQPVKCIQVDNELGIFKCGKTKIPTHNSTISAALLEWACNFYPRMPATILNANKTFALENLEKVKFMHSQLPSFLKTPLKYKGERKTTLDYKNDSTLRVFYPSSTTSPSMLARSLTSPILYIDESAHIPHMRVAYGSAAPVLSRAREQARKNNYPFFTLVTSTPNGTVGTGEWFYKMWINAIDADLIFDDQDLITNDAVNIINDPEKNGFIKVKFHWSEDPQKDEHWYHEQKKDLNFDTRQINQELDLVFVGSTKCIFDDEILVQLRSQKPVDKLKLIHGCEVNLFQHRHEFDTTDYFIVGIDTAKSLTGDFNAIQIFSYANFIQVGEYFGRLGSITRYSEVIIKLIDILNELTNRRIILAIENNSIGTSIIESLEEASTETNNYSQYIYSPSPDKYVGINTNPKSKGLMVSYLYNSITENSNCIKSSDLINQLNIIERKLNGSIGAQSGYNDDLFMAASLCAYARKLSSLEYEPLLGVSSIIQESSHIREVKSIIKSSEIRQLSNNMSIKYNHEEGGIEYIIGEDYEESSTDDYISIF